MKPEYFTFKWTMTLFCCFLPISFLPHILTLFIIEGWPAIYKVGISLINNFMAPHLLGMDNMMEMSAFMRDYMRKTDSFSKTEVFRIIQGAVDIPINQEDLDRFKEEFFILQA
jgi:hypothetical protein